MRVVTDHKPCFALMSGGHLNKRLLRFALALQGFRVELEYRPGRLHQNADGMSRQAWLSSDDESAHCALSDLTSGQILVGGNVGGVDQRGEKKREDRD